MFNFFLPRKPSLPAKIEFYKYDNLKFIRRLPVKTDNQKIVYLETLPNSDMANAQTILTNKNFDILGSHEYDMFDSLNLMDGCYMDVMPKHQKQGLGEILRLVSLIEMKENNLQKIKISSMAQALPFHTKYKFKPDFNFDVLAIKNILKEISEARNSVDNFAAVAKQMLNDINKNAFITSKHNYFKEVDSFILKYARANSRRWDSDKLQSQVPMVLTEKDVKHYASYYNKLFKKHEIDYRI